MKNQINIFIVDDNKVFSLALKADIENIFSKMSIKVYLFETGEKCMRRFLQVMPEFVILDYYLDSKDMTADNGIKILDWIKKENGETNVIMLTSDDHIDIALESFKHGASDYIVKTETQFKKINYSLLNLFKIIEEKSYAKNYKWLIVALFLGIGMLITGIVAYQIF
ncbi:MAG: response regulator [Bacteroidota bacterium]